MHHYLKKCFLLFLLAVLPAVASDARNKEKEPFELKRHEFALTGALWPGQYAFGYDFYEDTSGASASYRQGFSIAGLYDKSRYYHKESITNSWSASYMYNLTKIWSMGASLSYEGGWNRCYSRSDDVVVSERHAHYMTSLVHVRVSWLNRRYIRMYSDLGLGVVARFSALSELTFAGQGTFLGLSFGKQLFGIAEIGFGSIYVGGRVGIGYRF